MAGAQGARKPGRAGVAVLRLGFASAFQFQVVACFTRSIEGGWALSTFHECSTVHAALAMLLVPLAVLALALSVAGAYADDECVPSGTGTETIINERFRVGESVSSRSWDPADVCVGGLGTTVALCPGSVHRLRAPIELVASGQTLTTLGEPRGWRRALVVVEGGEQSMAVR